MAQINLLSQNTIDKIAAGEVVERPASVVKELIENAMDAGAGAITVEIKEGGISFIRVTDNGCGIEKEQVKKAFLRHATSKIREIEDLSYVESLGFRGEALSSIAAVSQVEVITKTAGELTGIKYSLEGGKETELEEVGAPTGTTFLIRHLFYNTPARRKFLKQPQTEGSYVADLMERYALARPDISMKFVNSGQVKFQTSGNGDLKEVIYRIYGREITDAIVPFQMQEELFQVTGYIGKPEINRANRNFEVFFMNGRYIRDDLLAKAVEEGYKSYVMQHKFPFVVLHFTMDPQEIDVNVHPAKLQIRIRKSREVYELLAAGILQRLKELEMIPSARLTEETPPPPVCQKAPEPFEIKRREQTGRIIGELQSDMPSPELNIHDNVIKADRHILVEKPVQMQLFEDKLLTRQAREEYQILGQIFSTYWLIAYQDKLLLLDQHAAHEKVKYERLLVQLSQKQTASQLLEPPMMLHLTAKEEEILLTYLDSFTQLGFELEEFGQSSYAVRSIPTELYGRDAKELFTDILDELSESPVQGPPEVILTKLASMACKAAVKGNHSLSREELDALLDELLTLENPYHCPHGRPTMISMSKYEIEKKFKRVLT